ncbi:hypothetical protein ACL02O_32985 [Micromonospora sp. MS34]|uniref:hypothetical protein n=1 Tax=Micromonospora sp. MS34 TaxID=3385971 RepID=UPI0039A1FF0E
MFDSARVLVVLKIALAAATVRGSGDSRPSRPVPATAGRVDQPHRPVRGGRFVGEPPGHLAEAQHRADAGQRQDQVVVGPAGAAVVQPPRRRPDPHSRAVQQRHGGCCG